MADVRLALVVSVDRYDNPGLRELAGPAADAAALAEVLGDPDRGAFDLEILQNPTSWMIYERVEGLLADRRPSDLVLLHFSCHGLKDLGGELYLAATNTVPDRLASTAVDAAWVNRMMQRSRAQRVVLLLDCCYGGAFERGVLARAGEGVDVGDQFRPGQLEEGRGRAVITSSTAMEYAFEGGRLSDGAPVRPSIFTGALVEGIRSGEADRDQDGYIELDELYDYVYESVHRSSPQQTPCKWEFGLRGGLYVARNPHRRVVPAVLSQDLLDLLDHPTPVVRLAAVEELARLATGPHLAHAAAARLALGQLLDDDSRRVAASATEALRHTAVRLGASSVDFGRVPPGEPRRVAEVRVEGPPLALASAVATSDARLRAVLDDGVLRITWLPEPGRLDEVVTLSGPAGEARLHVTGELTGVEDQPAVSGPTDEAGVGGPAPEPPVPAGHEQQPESGTAVLDRLRALGWRRAGLGVAAVFLVAAVIGIGVRAAQNHGAQRAQVAGPSVAVTVSGTTRPPIAGSVAKPVADGTITVGGEPEGVAVSPDGHTVYVANQRSRSLSVIDVARRTTTQVQLRNTPRFAAVSRDGKRVFVSTFEDDDSGSGITVVDAGTRTVVRAVPTGPRPYTPAVGSDGRVWVPIHDGSRVEVYDDEESLKIVATVPVPHNPHSLAFSPDGSLAYTPDHESSMEAYSAKIHGLVDQGLTCEYSIDSPDDHAY